MRRRRWAGGGVLVDGPRMLRMKEPARGCGWVGRFATRTDIEDVLSDHFISYDGLSYLIVFVPGSISYMRSPLIVYEGLSYLIVFVPGCIS